MFPVHATQSPHTLDKSLCGLRCLPGIRARNLSLTRTQFVKRWEWEARREIRFALISFGGLGTGVLGARLGKGLSTRDLRGASLLEAAYSAVAQQIGQSRREKIAARDASTSLSMTRKGLSGTEYRAPAPFGRLRANSGRRFDSFFIGPSPAPGSAFGFRRRDPSASSGQALSRLGWRGGKGEPPAV